MNRIDKLVTYLSPCKRFADVACDHGYCTEYMLKNNLCESAQISDISDKCLKKAEKLLSKFIDEGRVKSVCCDGLGGIDRNVDLVLIAGIGGDELIKILDEGFIPQNFVFQPMKNVSGVRRYLIEKGCAITRDDIFTDGKNYYFVICGRASGGEEKYSKAQMMFGRDSLKNIVFNDYLKAEILKKEGYLSRDMTDEHRQNLEESLAFLKGVYSGEIE
jgi:tRNA (adenine22-N1)-methyltransferase